MAICPVDGGFNDAEGFFQSYLALPVVLAFWACGYLWKREGWLKISQIDVDSGRRELDWDLINSERAKLATKAWYVRAWANLF